MCTPIQYEYIQTLVYNKMSKSYTKRTLKRALNSLAAGRVIGSIMTSGSDWFWPWKRPVVLVVEGEIGPRHWKRNWFWRLEKALVMFAEKGIGPGRWN